MRKNITVNNDLMKNLPIGTEFCNRFGGAFSAWILGNDKKTNAAADAFICSGALFCLNRNYF